MSVTTPSTFDRPAQREVRTSARLTTGARFRVAGRRFVAAREAAVHRDMIAGRYGPEAATVLRGRTDATH